MALTVTNHASTQPAGNGIESRGAAVARVVAEREAKLREATAAPEAPSAPAGEAANAAPAPKAEAPKSNEPDPRMLVEIERRERALDQAKREADDLRRELESAKSRSSDLKDWRKALELGGHKIEDVVQEWLGGESAPKDAPKDAPKPAAGPDAELLRRLEKLEQKEQEELRGRARMERRQQIAALIPQDSDDFEIMRTLGDNALDTFLSQLEGHEKGRPGGVGPNEIAALLKEFEGNTRKNLESQVSQLAKSKWVKQIMRKLLESSDSEPATGPEIKAPRDVPGPETSGLHVTESRNYTPSGITREQLISRARAAIVARMR